MRGRVIPFAAPAELVVEIGGQRQGTHHPLRGQGPAALPGHEGIHRFGNGRFGRLFRRGRPGDHDGSV